MEKGATGVKGTGNEWKGAGLRKASRGKHCKIANVFIICVWCFAEKGGDENQVR